MPAARIEPVYRPFDEGRFLLFDGHVALYGKDGPRPPMSGQIELQLGLASRLRFHLLGSRLLNALLSSSSESDPDPAFVVSDGADLTPPPLSAVEKREQVPRGEFPAAAMQVGDLDSATQVLVHLSGALRIVGPARELDDGERQVQINFALPGWHLTVAPHSSDADEAADFAAVVRATPTSLPISANDIDRLRRRLFLLLSFVANREIGVGPICGIAGERVVWAEWGTPRMMSGGPGVKWCPDPLVSDVLPVLAEGCAALSDDAAMEKIVDRAIGLSLVANAREVLDVRIPIACAGVELLAWTILEREGLVRGDEQSSLHDAVHFMLQWAGIGADIPEHFGQLQERRDRRAREGQRGWEGPELLFDIRNRLMHPPNNLSDPEWPDADELLEAWQLATWYLDLVLLRLLGYQGEYWSRLKAALGSIRHRSRVSALE